jgi:hypothetical protein
MHAIEKLLIGCSGAVPDLLARNECRSDATKYAMIGMLVLLTAVFAFCSSTFALYTGIGSLPLALAIGIAWALTIFTLDRFVVSGVRKSDVEHLPSEQRFKKRLVEFLVSLPRIVLAALISVVVATPLEMRFFQREINAQLAKNEAGERKNAGEVLADEFKEATELRAKNDELRKSIDDARTKYLDTETLATQELAGRALTGLSGDGPVHRRLKEQAEALKKLAEENKEKSGDAIKVNEKRIARLDAERQRRQDKFADSIDGSGGFLARYGALGQLADANPDMHLARTVLMLLFLSVELAPVIMKLLMRRGPYDDYIETLEHTVRVEEMLTRSHLNDDAHAEVSLHSARNDERIRLEQELSTKTYAYENVSNVAAAELEAAQAKLARASIQAWYRKQMPSVRSATP